MYILVIIGAAALIITLTIVGIIFCRRKHISAAYTVKKRLPKDPKATEKTTSTEQVTGKVIRNRAVGERTIDETDQRLISSTPPVSNPVSNPVPIPTPGRSSAPNFTPQPPETKEIITKV